jgi:hypothetical protein
VFLMAAAFLAGLPEIRQVPHRERQASPFRLELKSGFSGCLLL